jgi:hypothetical protein
VWVKAPGSTSTMWWLHQTSRGTSFEITKREGNAFPLFH